MDYKIPEEILSKIPDYFWAAFSGELVSIFGLSVFDKDEGDLRVLNYISGTGGWNAALKMTCHKLNMWWLYDYYDKLQWWESDLFDGEFEDMVTSKFVEADDVSHESSIWKYYERSIGEKK